MNPLATRPVQRVVIIDWSPIGDLVMLSPCVRALQAFYPQAHIALLGRPSSIGIYSNDPAIQQLITYDRASGDLDFRSFARTLNELKRGCFDIAYVFHNSIGSALMAWLGGVKRRIGFQHELRSVFLTRSYRIPERRQHLLETKADLLRLAGVPVADTAIQVSIDEKKAALWLRDKLGPNFGRNRPVIAIGLGASTEYKRWSGAGLLEYLKSFPVNSCDFVFVGAHEDRPLFDGVYSYNNTVVDLVGQTTIDELAWVMDRVDLYIGPDGGPVQIAIGRNKPVISLHSATDPAYCGPYNYEPAVSIRAHRICHTCDSKYGKHVRQCLHTLDAQEAYIATVGLLARYCKRWSLDLV